MKIITPNKENILMSEAFPVIKILRRFTVIPKDVTNTYKYMSDMFISRLN